MKAYIKPQTETVEISVENNLMADSGTLPASQDAQNNPGSGRAKIFTYELWGEDEE